MTRQYINCQFNPWDRRSYCYHNDGEPVGEGDKVRVTTKDGDKIVTVTSIVDQTPAFETKPISGKVDA